MAGGQSWRINQDAEDVFRSIDKRLGAQERRASPMSTFDLLGPGMSARAIQIYDWNAEEATFNGYFWSIPGALHSPDPAIPWTGQVIAKDDGSGLQQVWNVDPATGIQTWMRTYVPNALEDGNVVFTDWRRFATQSGLIGAPEIDQPVLDEIDNAIEYALAANKVFRQPDPPVSTEEYTLREGDTWFDTDDGNHIYLWDGAAWVDAKDAQIAESEALAAEALAAAQAAANAAADAMDFAEAKNRVFIQPDAPVSTAGYTLVAGDVWIDSDNNRMSTWNGTAWVDAQDAMIAAAQQTAAEARAAADAALADAEAAMDFAETKTKVYRQTSQPTGGTYAVGDTWYDTDDGNRIRTWDGSAWSEITLGAATIADGSITATEIQDDAITTPKLSANAITAKHTLTGPTIQTEATAARGVKLNSTGLIGYDTAGVAKFLLTTAGALSLAGSITAGSDISGATVTGGTVQTEATAARGIKINSTGLTAYDSTGASTFTVTAATGAVAMKGTLTAGSSISAATITGTLETTATANRGVKITNSGLTFYDNAGTALLTLASGTTGVGALAVTGVMTGTSISGSTVTGGTVQSEVTANRGVKINSAGITGYKSDGSGNANFTYSASTGAVVVVGDLTGSTMGAGTITGATVQTSETNPAVRMTPSGMWLYDAGGSPSVIMNATNGALTLKGSISSGSTIDGAIITGGTVQTQVEASRGIKMNSTGLTAYNGSGTPTFTITASTGSVSMVGSLTSGSTVTGATVTGGTVRTADPAVTAQHMVMKQDTAGGVLQGWTGLAGETNPGVFNPGARNGSQPQVIIQPGTTTTYPSYPYAYLVSGNGFANTYITLSAGTTSASGTLVAQDLFTANNGATVNGNVSISGAITGMGRQMNKWDFGNKTGTVDANGDIVVSGTNSGLHDVIFIQGNDNAAQARVYTIMSKATGTFTVRTVRSDTGAVLASGTSVNFFWIAFKA